MTDIIQSGYDLTMEIVETFPPKYWKKENYGHNQYLIRDIDNESDEFLDLEEKIIDAQEEYGVDYSDDISKISRVQNPYTYSRFILRKKYLKTKHGFVNQTRKFKLIPYKYLNLALKYNCDSRRFGKKTDNYVFYPTIPHIWDNYVLLVVQVLTTKEVNAEIECNRDSEFYIEYVVYFE